MSDRAVVVENVSKRYLIGHQRARGDGLRHAVEDAFRAPLKWLSAQRSRLRASTEEFWALQKVSFEVKQGEVIGIIGRNGAGKSTLLKILSRITQPTEGCIRLNGRVASLLEVGTGFHQELTGRENIFLNGAILGMSRIEIKRKFEEIVAFSEVEKFLDTPVKRYSSGMYVRLAFSVAAHLEPEILIVDEVLAVGDADFQRKCIGKMQNVAGQGRTVLFVSHNMAAVRSLCSRAIMLHAGKITENGNVEKVIERNLLSSIEAARVVIDLDAVTRTGAMGTRVKITRVEFNKGEEIKHGKPLSIDIHFNATSEEENVSFGIGFCNRDGIRLLSIDTDIPGQRLTIPTAASGVVSLHVPTLHLEPDHYSIDIGARSGDNYGLDYVPGSASVLVIPSESTPPVIAMRESGRGGFRQPAEWTVHFDGSSN
jgi:lipopolysaccharide transport system ATP-binding protein